VNAVCRALENRKSEGVASSSIDGVVVSGAVVASNNAAFRAAPISFSFLLK
jgi:hypothetical protein